MWTKGSRDKMVADRMIHGQIVLYTKWHWTQQSSFWSILSLIGTITWLFLILVLFLFV